VIVGHGVTVRRNEEARTLTHDEVTATVAAGFIGRLVRHAEAAEELLETGRQVAVRKAHRARAAVDLDAHRDHRRLHLFDDVGKADRPLRGVGARGRRERR
jgi:hypothetical protein